MRPFPQGQCFCVSPGSWFSPGSGPLGGPPHDGVGGWMSPKVRCEFWAPNGPASTPKTRSSCLRPGGTAFRSGGTDLGVSIQSCWHFLLGPGEGGSVTPQARLLQNPQPILCGELAPLRLGHNLRVRGRSGAAGPGGLVATLLDPQGWNGNLIQSLSAVIGFHLHRPTEIPKVAGVSVMLAERDTHILRGIRSRRLPLASPEASVETCRPFKVPTKPLRRGGNDNSYSASGSQLGQAEFPFSDASK